ncbi:MAG: uroporphyrinogen decarboxylase family protein [Candidatus Helarchaeota archaeon]
MNSRDLTMSAISGIPEKVPFNPFIMHLAAVLNDIDYSGKYVKDPEILANSQIKCSEFFGIDHVNVSTDAYREASAWGVEIDFSGHTPVPKKGTELNWQEFDNMETPDLTSSDRIMERVKAISILSKKVGTKQCIIGWIEAPFAEIVSLFGMMNVFKINNKKWNDIIKKLIKRIVPVQLEFAKLQIEAGADIIGAGDSAISQIGPWRYKEACLEYTQKLFKDIQKYVPVLYHTCGDNSTIDKNGNDMLKLIAKSGASILDIDYQVNLKLAKQKIGNEICIRGNSNTSLLGKRDSTPEEIINDVSNILEIGKPGGMYMFAAGCEWPWEPKDICIRNLSIAKTICEKLGYY